MSHRVNALNEVPLFHDMDDEVLAALASQIETREFAPRQNVLREGENGDEMFILAEGRVEVLVNADTADEALLASLAPGSFFGEMSLIENTTRCATIRAVEGSRAHVIHRHQLDDLAKSRPDQYRQFVFNLCRGLASRMRMTADAIVGGHAPRETPTSRIQRIL